MNIREALIAEHSKRQTLKIVNYIGSDPEKFSELMSIFFEGNYRLTQRASWSLNYCAEFHPELIKPYLAKLIDQLTDREGHSAVRRNIVRLLQNVEIPAKFAGKLFSICIDLLDDPNEPVAVRVFAMSVAAKIANGQKDLLNEIRLITEKHIPHSTAAFRARARSVFKSGKKRKS